MCVKFPVGDLNPDPYPSHPTSIYTYRVTTAPRVRGGKTYYLYTLDMSYVNIKFYMSTPKCIILPLTIFFSKL